MTDFSNSTLGVTGAAGLLGRAVLAELLARGAKHVVAVTRDPVKLKDIPGIEVRPGDFSDPVSLDSAFAGVERLLVISTDALGQPGLRLAQHTAAVDAAEKAGVSHVLYTSITNPYPDAKAAVANDHFWTEARILRFAGDWTMLRDNIYMDMLLQDVDRILASGQLVHAAGGGLRAYVSRADVAATAAGALLTAAGRQIVDVSGPEAVPMTAVAAAIAAAYGRPVEAVAISPAASREGMIGAGLPPALADAFLAFDTDAARGVFGITSDAVERFAGRPGQTLAAFLAQHPLATVA